MDQFSETDVKNALTEFHGRILGIVTRGFAEWLSVQECRLEKGFGPILYPRTIANYVFDAIAREARSEFTGDPDVRVFDEAQTVKFCFRDTVIARFKKGDDDNLGRNICTQAVLDFIDPQQSLPNFPPKAAKVEIVWQVNDIGTEIEKVMVVARDHDAVRWLYEIEAEADRTGVVPLPVAPAPDDDQEEPLVATKKKDIADERG